MARIEGTQNIPSTWKTSYDGSLTPLMPNAVIRRRYPWNMPAMRDGGSGVTNNQVAQRTRWRTIRNKFKNLSTTDRARWYAARPPWHSLLWYYNYFMMSGLLGNATINDKGAGVIKDINHYAFSLASGASPAATIAIDTCDPSKSVPFFFGAGVVLAEGSIPVAVYPFLKSLNSTQMIAAASMALDYPANLSVTLIEYI